VFLAEVAVTRGTPEGTVPRMYAVMSLQVTFLQHALTTDLTDMLLEENSRFTATIELLIKLHSLEGVYRDRFRHGLIWVTVGLADHCLIFRVVRASRVVLCAGRARVNPHGGRAGVCLCVGIWCMLIATVWIITVIVWC